MISIIIPTFNRAQSLLKTLRSIEEQNFSNDNFEVIVVDDGSNDDTRKRVEDFTEKSKIKLRYFYQENAGPGKARNFGIEEAKGEIVLFCGDDMVFDKDMLYQHDLFHMKTKVNAVLGLVLWDKEIKPTDFMNFLAPNGPQFHYNTIKNINDAGFNHFFTSNISLKKKWIEEEKFGASFRDATFEDIDLGLRLEKKGLKITYNKDAIVYHYHNYTPELFYQKMIKVGGAFVKFKRKFKNDKLNLLKINIIYAPFMLFPFGLRLFGIISRLISRLGFVSKISKRVHWWFNIAYFYYIGIIKELRG